MTMFLQAGVVLSGLVLAALATSCAAQSQQAPPTAAERADWPSATGDNGINSFLLFDNLEYQGGQGADSLRWDVLGWRGGDSQRIWFKSEGQQNLAHSDGSEYEAQVLYGKLIAPFFDLQAGLRVNQQLEPDSSPTRAYAVLALQGLSRYRFDVEPALFLSHKGKLSARFTGTYDILLSQQLILQPRLETNVAAQKDAEISTGSGFNDLELGLRLRYEIRREFAPYIGVTWLESFGATRRFTVREGGDASTTAVVAGLRMWF